MRTIERKRNKYKVFYTAELINKEDKKKSVEHRSTIVYATDLYSVETVMRKCYYFKFHIEQIKLCS